MAPWLLAGLLAVPIGCSGSNDTGSRASDGEGRPRDAAGGRPEGEEGGRSSEVFGRFDDRDAQTGDARPTDEAEELRATEGDGDAPRDVVGSDRPPKTPPI